MGCTKFETINFHPAQQIAHFGAWIFENTRISSLQIPDSVETIDIGAFQGTRSLTQVTFGADSRLIRLGSRCFADSGLREIFPPASVYQFEVEVFCGCQALKSFVLPADSGLEYLAEGAFRNSGVQLIVAPGIRVLADNPFPDCPSLRSVKFALPEQTKDQTDRDINLPPDLFGGKNVYVIYPEGTLRAARLPMKAANYTFA
jgi:hypothetical protein